MNCGTIFFERERRREAGASPRLEWSESLLAWTAAAGPRRYRTMPVGTVWAASVLAGPAGGLEDLGRYPTREEAMRACERREAGEAAA